MFLASPALEQLASGGGHKPFPPRLYPVSSPNWGGTVRLVPFAALAAAALFLASPALAQPVTIAGELVLSEDFSIAQNSYFQVRVVDLDAYQAGALGGTEIAVGPGVEQPVAFSFDVFVGEMPVRGRYGIEARLLSISRAQGTGFIFDTRAPVEFDPFAGEPVTVVMTPTPAERLSRVDWWAATEILGVSLDLDGQPAVARFLWDAGFHDITIVIGCGTLTADAAFFFHAITVYEIDASGLGTCDDPAVTAFEEAALRLLELARAVDFDEEGRVTLLGDEATPLATFMPVME
ncbi:MAG: hypothetical protein KIS96_15810 [Bauldia sp.]|nr:hypothetical protein [Bauldia sp.]